MAQLAKPSRVRKSWSGAPRWLQMRRGYTVYHMVDRAILVAALAWIAGCQLQHQSGASVGVPRLSPSVRAAELSHLWVFYGGETEPFCISLNDDSTGRFYGGFVGKNPLRWRYDSLTGRLDITYSHLTSADYAVLKDGLTRGRFFAFDSLTATASYLLHPTTPRINVFGWVLEPAESLEDWKKPFAVKGCPLLPDAGGA